MNYQHIDAPEDLLKIARKMGISHPVEALLCAPDRYDDFRLVKESFDGIGPDAERSSVLSRVFVMANPEGRVSARGFARRGAYVPRGGYKDVTRLQLHDPFARQCFRLEVDVQDANGQQAIQTAFGVIEPWRQVQPGEELFLYGKANRNYGKKLRFENARIINPSQIGTISPTYLGIQGKVSGESVQKMISWVFENDERAEIAFLAAAIAIRNDCGSMNDADILNICVPRDCIINPQNLPGLLVHLHTPSESIAEGMAARSIAARICALGMQCRAQRANARLPSPDAPLPINPERVARLISDVEALRGHALTSNQKNVMEQMVACLKKDRPMNGLLSGEVGSGKTLAYALPAVAAHCAGARVAIMTPTTLLADQIARTIADDFIGHAEVERVKSGGKIRNHAAILVGTMGLGSVAEKEGYQPDFLIMDEQHKLDTASRMRMVQPFTHTLEVSATPIPRSLALSLYDGMDLFTLNEQPVVRDIQTALIDVNDRNLATRAMWEALSAGQRCAVVYPRVEEQDAQESGEEKKDGVDSDSARRARALKSAKTGAALFEQHFPGKVVLLHGQTPDKAAALAAFRSGEKPLMVTTTIFETGIDVPDVKVLVVRDPQQLGLSQLHQLRGRLARAGGNAQCFLLTENLNDLSMETHERLTVFCQSMNGYELACSDMLARGAGDLQGLEQKGNANATFKGLKITAEDLYMNDANRTSLKMEIEADPADLESRRERAPRQASLFR